MHVPLPRPALQGEERQGVVSQTVVGLLGDDRGTLPLCEIEMVKRVLVHHVRTVARISGPTPVHHPKMHPPKQPIESQKTLVAGTRPSRRSTKAAVSVSPSAAGRGTNTFRVQTAGEGGGGGA